MSSAGSTMAPFSSAATARIKVTVAGMEPVTPATMTGAVGDRDCKRAASARMSALVRATGETKPRSARNSGQKSVMIFRNSTVLSQCSE